jgi:dTDP-4-dehydrorhamnose reductase
MKIFLIGGSGLLGTNIAEQGRNIGAEVWATHHNCPSDQTDIELDKTDERRTAALIQEYDPDIIIDTAAFHSVDDCETNRARAWNVNANGTGNVAQASNAVNAHLIYISTDYVFGDGVRNPPYSEKAEISPVNYYGWSKAAGEQAARVAESSTVLRPSVIFGSASSNFITWARNQLQSGDRIDIVNDQISSPTYAPDLARACIDMARRQLTGTYHAGGPEMTSRYEFTKKFAGVLGYNRELVSPISSEKLGQAAERPKNCSLDSNKLYETLDFQFRTPEQAFENLA